MYAYMSKTPFVPGLTETIMSDTRSSPRKDCSLSFIGNIPPAVALCGMNFSIQCKNISVLMKFSIQCKYLEALKSSRGRDLTAKRPDSNLRKSMEYFHWFTYTSDLWPAVQCSFVFWNHNSCSRFNGSKSSTFSVSEHSVYLLINTGASL